ncbi:MAG: amino acid ABC transporter substrate-binding protein [Bradymonadales bacterium]|nr:amino acid ABC transporter substrate-binding protein [Bradymonadales bacterium]
MKDGGVRSRYPVKWLMALLVCIGLLNWGCCDDCPECEQADLVEDTTPDITDIPAEVQPDVVIDPVVDIPEEVQQDIVEEVQTDVSDVVVPPEAVVVAGPVSVTGRYTQEGQQALWGIQAAVTWVNEVYGGVTIDGVAHPLEFQYTDDASGGSTVADITNAYCDDDEVSFIMGPYSSGFTNIAAPITEACDKILLNVGGASDSIMAQGYENVVQILTPGSQYHLGILEMIAQAVGTSDTLDLALAYENDAFSKSVAAGVRAAVEDHWNYDIVFDGTYPAGAVDEALGTFVASLIGSDPDVIVGGGHAVDSRALTRVLDAQGFQPSAMSLLVGPANANFYEMVEACPPPCDFLNHPAEGVMAPAQWALGVTYNQADIEEQGGTWFGPSQNEFLDLFHEAAGLDKTPAYQAAQGAAAILVLVMAIEEAGSLDTDEVRAALEGLDVVTLYGGFVVDETGKQVAHSMVEIQWQYGQMAIIWPEEARTGNLVYPMP